MAHLFTSLQSPKRRAGALIAGAALALPLAVLAAPAASAQTGSVAPIMPTLSALPAPAALPALAAFGLVAADTAEQADNETYTVKYMRNIAFYNTDKLFEPQVSSTEAPGRAALPEGTTFSLGELGGTGVDLATASIDANTGIITVTVGDAPTEGPHRQSLTMSVTVTYPDGTSSVTEQLFVGLSLSQIPSPGDGDDSDPIPMGSLGSLSF